MILVGRPLREQEEGEDEGEEGKWLDDRKGGEGFAKNGGLFRAGLVERPHFSSINPIRLYRDWISH